MKKTIIILTILVLMGGSFFYLFSIKNKSLISENINHELKCKDCNLIMISLSNVSAEHMSMYDYGRKTTPNLDKWSQDAIIFDNVFTQASWTLPVATSLFTSLYPYTHKITNRYAGNILDKKIKTLPEILRDNGYKTAAFTGGLDYSNKFGHMRGFQDFEEVANPSYKPAHQSNFTKILMKSSIWLKNNSNQKFFLFIHGYDAHCPFTPPKKFKGTFSKKTENNSSFNDSICYRGYKNSDDSSKYTTQYYKTPDKMGTITLNIYDVALLKDLYDEEVMSVDELVGNFLTSLGNKIL